jgi:hypothetical protein
MLVRSLFCCWALAAWLGNPASAAQTVTSVHTFSWWRAATISETRAAIQSAIGGYVLGYEDGIIRGHYDVIDSLAGRRDELPSDLIGSADRVRFRPPPRFSKSIDDYRRAIDRCYAANNAQKETVSFELVLFCMADQLPMTCGSPGRDRNLLPPPSDGPRPGAWSLLLCRVPSASGGTVLQR